MKSARKLAIINRLLVKTEKTEYCWNWKGNLYSGYGQFFFNGVNTQAHRASYLLFKGKIPKELQLDHLCRNRACINPDHLEIVDIKTNVLRGEGITAKNARKISCLRGHEFTEENTYFFQKARNTIPQRRDCRLCRHKRVTDYRNNNRELVNLNRRIRRARKKTFE